MRVGAVPETSWEILISNALRRPNHHVVRSRPNEQVFYAHTQGKQLNMYRPAKADQQKRFLSIGADLAGMMAPVIPHDIRRGEARAIFEQTGDLYQVGRQLGHSVASVESGVTEGYVGFEQRRIHTSLGQKAGTPSREEALEIPSALQAYNKRKISSEEIERYCSNYDLDLDDQNLRMSAREALERIQRSLGPW